MGTDSGGSYGYGFSFEVSGSEWRGACHSTPKTCWLEWGYSWGWPVTDVFLKVFAMNPLRAAMANLSIQRWRMERDVNLHCMVAEDSITDGINFGTRNVTFLPEEWFHIECRRYAEQESRSTIYVLADDDQLIIGRDWVKRGIEILSLHSDFAFLAARSINGENPDHCLCHPNNEVSEHPSHNVGTPYFTFKDRITDFPEGENPAQYDGVFSSHCIAKGYKVGFIPKLRFNHVGCEYSTCVAGHWGA